MTTLHLRKSIVRSLGRYGVGSGTHRKLCLMAVIFSMFAGTTWAHPTGWVDFADPYLWSQDANVWAYMNPGDTQWILNMNTREWTALGNGSGQNGWMFFGWPYAYSWNQNTWYYFDENSGNSSFGQDSPDVGSRLWIFNFGTNQWEFMNSPLPLVCCLPPARDILGIWTGSGSYIDYTCDDNNNVIQNAFITASFTFLFFNPGDGSTQFVAGAPTPIHILSFQQIAPNQFFQPPFDWSGPATTINISSSRWWCDIPLLFSSWSFNFTTNTMAGSITRDPGAPVCLWSPVGINSTGLNGIVLTRQNN